MAKANTVDAFGRPVLRPGTGDISAPEVVSHADWSETHGSRHVAQFYETDEFLLQTLAPFIAAGLHNGESSVIVATSAHRADLEARLQTDGVDVAAAHASGQYVALDAAETLAQFMVAGVPDPERFAEVIGGIIAQAAASRPRVRIFGEMVALLWAEQNYDGALRLEALWNTLHESHVFALFCAYPMDGFRGEALTSPLHDVCAEHSHVIPAESYSALSSPDDRLRAIILLQQKASLLEGEIAERRKVEERLRAAKAEMEIQVEDLRRLHDLSVRLTRTLDISSVLHEVLQAALAVQHTSLGLLSLCDPERDGLRLEVSSGFDPAFLREVEWVPSGCGAYGTSYAQQRRVVVEDVEVDPIFAPYREAALVAGFRACHSTPLITRSGTLIGVLSVHFRLPHRPSERETRLMDLYGQMAADFIETARLHHRVEQELEAREEALQREQHARAAVESASRLKDEFLATVSHELRTPLTAILGWSQVLRNRLSKGGVDPTGVERALDVIETNAKTQAQLVEDILDVSRVITGKLRLEFGPVDARAVINAAVDSVQPAADAKEIQLQVTLDPSARHLVGDESRLQQVVWNLLANAIKFTPTGGRVDVHLERAGSNVQIRVSDTGEGISPDALPIIFDRFSQVDGTSTRRHGGLGLGLSIVRHLVELHGGTVQADSPGPGAGATFTIRLPNAATPKPEQQGSDGVAHLLPRQATTTDLQSGPMLEGVQVLLVDDDRDTLQVLTAMLTEFKASVQAVDSAAAALAALDRHTPDVLVSDVAMPIEDGYMLIEKVRAREVESGKQTPAVALTAYVRVEDRVRALAAGFNSFVPKPVEPDELMMVIGNLVELSKTSNPAA